MDTKPHIPEVAVILGGRDITRGYVDSLPLLPPTDRILQMAGGWKGYDEILRDDQVAATFAQRRLAVVRKPWLVEPGGTSRNDKRAAQLVQDTLETLGWDNVTDHMLYGRFFGFSVAEILWSVAKDGIRIQDIKVRDRARFAFAPDGALRMMTMSAPNGEALPERKFWVAAVGASHADEPYGRGLANALYWPVWFKRHGAKFWAIYLEKFGAPTPIGRFPAGTVAEERTRLLEAIQSIQTEAGIVLPEGITIELLEATRSGQAGYEAWMGYWDHAIAKIVLGQTMTTDNGSSLSQARVHMEVREDLVSADADLICQSANASWVRWLVDYNIPGAAYPRLWRDNEVQEDQKTRADRDKILYEMGYRLTPEAVARIYGPDYESIKQASPETAQEKQPAAGTVQAANFAEMNHLEFPDQTALDDAVKAISSETLDEQGRAMLEPLLDALKGMEDDPVAFLGWLAETFPQADGGALEEMLTRLLFVAELWGRINAESNP